MNHDGKAFSFGNATPSEKVGDGITRQIFGHGESIMMVRVEFEAGAVGYVHSHPHSQVSYVESGEFDVLVDGEKRRLGPGDSFFVQPNLDHGAECCKAGVLIDVFSPAREDFIAEEQVK